VAAVYFLVGSLTYSGDVADVTRLIPSGASLSQDWNLKYEATPNDGRSIVLGKKRELRIRI
jgi:hypothetical protein